MSLDPVADFESLLKKNEFLFMVCKSSRPPSPISIAYGSSCGYRGSWCLETLVSAVAEKGGAVVTVTSETADMLPKTRQAFGLHRSDNRRPASSPRRSLQGKKNGRYSRDCEIGVPKLVSLNLPSWSFEGRQRSWNTGQLSPGS